VRGFLALFWLYRVLVPVDKWRELPSIRKMRKLMSLSSVMKLV
jgi:hypothetical protein